MLPNHYQIAIVTRYFDSLRDESTNESVTFFQSVTRNDNEL